MKRFLFMSALIAGLVVTAAAQEKMMAAPPMMMSSETKVEFTTLEDAQMIAEKGPAVLFFYASWCPSCRTGMADIDARLTELGNVTVVVVNYDKETQLKKKYGISYQHTFVQIDPSGEQIALWNGGGVDEILENVVHNTMMKGEMN